MTVTVRFPGSLRKYCGGVDALQVEARDVRSALADIERNYPALYRNICEEPGSVRRHINLFVNKDNTKELNGLDTALHAGDVITILPAVSGG